MSHQTPPPNPRDQGHPYAQPQGQYAQPAYGQNAYPQPPQRTGNGFGVAALVVGIIAVLLAWLPIINIGAIVLGVIAVILGILGVRKKWAGKGMSIAGIVLGAVAILLSVIILVATAAFVGVVQDEIEKAERQTYSVEYRVTVDSGEAQASYTESGGTGQSQVSGDWREQQTLNGLENPTLVVTGDAGAEGQSLSCEILVDGLSVVAETGTSKVSCVAPTRS